MRNDEPLRFSMGMKPGFAEKYSRDQVLGVPIRETLGDDVMITGVVVDWIDEPDGSVTLIIEQRDIPDA